MTNGDRVKQARELTGLTQIQLAADIDVTQSAIAHYESDRSSPTESVLHKIALRTGFPPAFFGQDDAPEFPLGSLLFRARSTSASRERTITHRYAQLVFECYMRMAGELQTPPLKSPRLLDDAVKAASLTRAWLGLSPHSPIDHLTNAVERNGVVVLALPVRMHKVDAFSAWSGVDREIAVVATSGVAAGDRLRFSVAHELAHLMLHEAIRGRVADAERAADDFAAELLLPEIALREELIPPITLASLATLKPRWGVSIQALIRRAYDLEIITKRQYGYLFAQLSSRGWRLAEPSALDIAVEKPRAFSQMAELLYGLPVDYGRFATDMRIGRSLARSILGAFQFANGELDTSTPQQEVSRKKPIPFRTV